jgi:hypothetical protein
MEDYSQYTGLKSNPESIISLLEMIIKVLTILLKSRTV